MTNKKILIVDDEENIIQLVQMYLEREGFHVVSAMTGKLGIESVYLNHPDLIILDIMLPEVDGLEICKRLRKENVFIPIIMLTARDEDIDKIIGLEFGADDYIIKPFNPHELTARVKAILRREKHFSENNSDTISLGNMMISPERREVIINGKTIELRHQEFNLLHILALNKGIVLSRERLLNLAWGYDFQGYSRTVDVHISSLRQKLKDSGVIIETVINSGYKLVL